MGGSVNDRSSLFAKQKGMGLKTSTTSVRAAYIRCLLACVTPSSAFKAATLIPKLMACIDKALGQSTQVRQVIR